jgi:hypothetical protein
MSKKHFIAIAATIRSQIDSESHLIAGPRKTVRLETIAESANRLADVFANENPRFDRARFLAACGINR